MTITTKSGSVYRLEGKTLHKLGGGYKRTFELMIPETPEVGKTLRVFWTGGQVMITSPVQHISK